MSTVEHESEPATTTEALPPPTVPPARPGVARGGDRIVAGVADGLSDALGVAPMWTRLAFVVLAFFGGLGVAAYVAAWLLMPARPGAPAPRGLRRVAGLAIVPLWLAVIANEGAGQDLFKAPYLIAGLLVGVALALWKPGSTQPRPPVMTTPRTVTPDAVAGPVPDPITAPAPVTPRPRPPVSPLGRVTFGLALIVAAVGTAVTQGSSTGVKVSFAVAGVICAVGLLVGVWFGRARWLVVPALLFAGVSVAGAATAGLGVHQSWSGPYTSWYPGDPLVPTPPTFIDKGAGDTYLRLEGITAPVDGVIRVGHGQVTISVDEEVRLELHARVGIGSIELPTGTSRGYRREATYSTGPADAPLVRYDVAVGFGSIDVTRYAVRPVPASPIPPKIALPPGAIGPDGFGGYVYEDGTTQRGDGTIVLPDGTTIDPDGTVRLPTGGIVLVPGAPPDTAARPAREEPAAPPATEVSPALGTPAVPTTEPGP